MTFVRSRTRRSRNNKTAFAAALLLVLMTLAPLAAMAQGANVAAPSGIKQFQRQFSLGGRLPVAILIVGFEKDAANIEKLFDLLTARANESFGRLDDLNPQSDILRINAGAGSGSVKVSEDVAAAFKAASQAASWSGGAYDFVTGTGTYKDVGVSDSSVELKKPGMEAHLGGMLSGFFAEYLIRLINASSMQNAMVKVGNVFRGIGQGMYGPWKIQVQDDSGTYAHHALNLSVSNTGIATVSANQFRSGQLLDPRTKQQIAPRCKGVTLIMNDAALAEGVAQAIFVLGAEEGMKLLSKYGKGLIVDNDGKFLRSPGF